MADVAPIAGGAYALTKCFGVRHSRRTLPLISLMLIPFFTACGTEQLTSEQSCALTHLCVTDPCHFTVASMTTTRNVITADTVDEFIALSYSMPGTSGEFGHFTSHIDTNSDADNRIVALTVSGDTMLPAFGPGLAQPGEALLIRQAVAAITAHEASHRRVFLTFAKRACREMGAPGVNDQQVVQRAFCALGPGTYAEADQAVDARDGEIFIDVDPETGVKSIKTRGRGTAQSSHMIQGPICAR